MSRPLRASCLYFNLNWKQPYGCKKSTNSSDKILLGKHLLFGKIFPIHLFFKRKAHKLRKITLCYSSIVYCRRCFVMVSRLSYRSGCLVEQYKVRASSISWEGIRNTAGACIPIFNSSKTQCPPNVCFWSETGVALIPF